MLLESGSFWRVRPGASIARPSLRSAAARSRRRQRSGVAGRGAQRHNRRHADRQTRPAQTAGCGRRRGRRAIDRRLRAESAGASGAALDRHQSAARFRSGRAADDLLQRPGRRVRRSGVRRRTSSRTRRFTRLWTGALWIEGPAWNGVGRYLVFSDIPNNRQLRWIDDDGRVSVFRSPSNNSNGNTFDFQGRQLSCEHLTRRVVRYEHDGSITIIADAFDGKRLNSPNDVVAHPDGSYWFTDPPYGASLYEGQPDARGGPTNPDGRLHPRLGQPPEAGRMRRELPNAIYRVGPERPCRSRGDRGSGSRSERSRVLARLQAFVRREHRARARATRARVATATCTCSTSAPTTVSPVIAFLRIVMSTA